MQGNLNRLEDISDIKINKNLQGSKRINEFVRRIKNPYFFRVGRMSVKVTFDLGNETLQELLIKTLTNISS